MAAEGQTAESIVLHTDEQLQTMIDPLLEHMDKDKDGFISYPEYTVATDKQNADEHK